MELNKAIQSRHCTRKFSKKKPDWRDIIECIDAARFAPMAGNNYTLKFILVYDKEKIQKLADASQQPFIAQAHYVVIACTNPKRTILAYGEKGKNYLKQQAGAAIENFLLKIQEAGLATCWVGYFTESQVKKIANIPAKIEVEALFPIGYESHKPKTTKTKIELDNILYFDKYNKKQMKKIKKLDV